MGDMRMVVGLGNPGDRYLDTRHNMGFMVIDSLADALKIEVGKRKFGARFALGEFADKKLILLKPWQFMNRSGQAVATAAGFYRLDVGDLLVVSDDLDLEPGRIRLRAKGSAGGHNGLADIAQKLGTNEFARCRVGIGCSDRQEAVSYVLERPKKGQKPLLDSAVERARDAVFCWIECGIETAMNEFNRVSE
ncbi:MAG: aminoacyl-tRNA hydrolase [Planctomycetes bacterium]|nr:aminoacyl-tRNA hydrolase [Planctomycetota bacterium]MBL7189583.1 aminoacyl-tRNA hydrolase [Phycisphaerae bacterium]